LLSLNRAAGKQQPIFRNENPFTSTLIPQQSQPTIPPLIFPPSRAVVTPQSRPPPTSPLAPSSVVAVEASAVVQSKQKDNSGPPRLRLLGLGLERFRRFAWPHHLTKLPQECIPSPPTGLPPRRLFTSPDISEPLGAMAVAFCSLRISWNCQPL
jgi:hypothetical protein